MLSIYLVCCVLLVRFAYIWNELFFNYLLLHICYLFVDICNFDFLFVSFLFLFVFFCYFLFVFVIYFLIDLLLFVICFSFLIFFICCLVFVICYYLLLHFLRHSYYEKSIRSQTLMMREKRKITK